MQKAVESKQNIKTSTIPTLLGEQGWITDVAPLCSASRVGSTDVAPLCSASRVVIYRILATLPRKFNRISKRRMLVLLLLLPHRYIYSVFVHGRSPDTSTSCMVSCTQTPRSLHAQHLHDRDRRVRLVAMLLCSCGALLR